MSFQTFVTQRITALTERLNSISTNAKKIDELPYADTAEVGDKFLISRNGVSKHINLSSILRNLNTNTDGIIEIQKIIVVNNTATIKAGARWRLDDVQYSNTSDVVLNIQPPADGFKRKDIIVANKLNGFTLIKGEESADVANRPDTPADTIFVTDLILFGNQITIDEGGVIIGNQFITKSEKRVSNQEGGQSLSYGENTFFKLTENWNGDVLWVSYDTGTALFYEGQEFYIHNLSGRDVTIKNNPTSSTSGKLYFSFPTSDFLLKQKTIIQFKYQNGKLHYVGVEVSDGNLSQDIENDKTSTIKFPSVKAVYDWAIGLFQPKLTSGTNIKTVGGISLLGGGDIPFPNSSGNIDQNAVFNFLMLANTNNRNKITTSTKLGEAFWQLQNQIDSFSEIKNIEGVFTDTFVVLPSDTTNILGVWINGKQEQFVVDVLADGSVKVSNQYIDAGRDTYYILYQKALSGTVAIPTYTKAEVDSKIGTDVEIVGNKTIVMTPIVKNRIMVVDNGEVVLPISTSLNNVVTISVATYCVVKAPTGKTINGATTDFIINGKKKVEFILINTNWREL